MVTCEINPWRQTDDEGQRSGEAGCTIRWRGGGTFLSSEKHCISSVGILRGVRKPLNMRVLLTPSCFFGFYLFIYLFFIEAGSFHSMFFVCFSDFFQHFPHVFLCARCREK